MTGATSCEGCYADTWFTITDAGVMRFASNVLVGGTASVTGASLFEGTMSTTGAPSSAGTASFGGGYAATGLTTTDAGVMSVATPAFQPYILRV